MMFLKIAKAIKWGQSESFGARTTAYLHKKIISSPCLTSYKKSTLNELKFQLLDEKRRKIFVTLN